jgi:hypothetical protein
MLGWQEGAWGYHADDGTTYESGQFGGNFGPGYDEGSIVGCGVNFKEGTAFYTCDGKVIGKCFFCHFSPPTSHACSLSNICRC